jgi:aspartate-semialdehyde dehydrogenase
MAIEELRRQVEQISRGEEVTREVYPHQIAFNVMPHVDSFLDTGYTKEEMKMQNEGRKILHHDRLMVSCTCVRVPVYRAPSISVSAEFQEEIDVAGARQVIGKFPGIQVKDDPGRNEYPMPLEVAGENDCYVGRMRKDLALENGLSFWVVGDQLLKGAALNAVQIAELLVEG